MFIFYFVTIRKHTLDVRMKDRIKRHSSGYIEATKKRLPIKLSTYFAFQEEHAAFNFEKYLKSGSERAFARRHGFIE